MPVAQACPYNHLEYDDRIKPRPCGQSRFGHVLWQVEIQAVSSRFLVARTGRREYLSVLMTCAMGLRRREDRMTRSAPRDVGHCPRPGMIEPVGPGWGLARAGAGPQRLAIQEKAWAWLSTR